MTKNPLWTMIDNCAEEYGGSLPDGVSAIQLHRVGIRQKSKAPVYAIVVYYEDGHAKHLAFKDAKAPYPRTRWTKYTARKRAEKWSKGELHDV
jgi:phosphoribosyl-AMP cyclohydrolase